MAQTPLTREIMGTTGLMPGLPKHTRRMEHPAKYRHGVKFSGTRLSRIREQGYHKGFSDKEVCEHAPGNRFAYQLCTLLFTTGLVLTNIPILAVAAVIAALTVVLPYHPFDYLYNSFVRHILHKPELPTRTAQARFACGTAAIFLGIIIYLFTESLFMWAYILGGMLFTVALLVSSIDLCIPSKVYNAMVQGGGMTVQD